MVEKTEPPPPDYQRVELAYHDKELAMSLGTTGLKPGMEVRETRRPVRWDPSMRFGITMFADEKGNKLDKPKPLTRKLYDETNGITNNTVVRLDTKEWIFGEGPWRDTKTDEAIGTWTGGGRWRTREQPLGNDEEGKPRLGLASVWEYPDQQITVTQSVEIVRGPQSGMHDTVLIRYFLTNEGSVPHSVGIRFLLDTFIGDNDGVPFLIPIPGQNQLCTTSMDFNDPPTMPSYIQAREKNEDLTDPGTIAQVQLKVEGLEAPSRVTLGAWPNPELRPRGGEYQRCRQEKTMWEVPLMDINIIKDAKTNQGDSAVVLYWNERDLAPGQVREVGFAYGVGQVSSAEGKGKLAVSLR